jgi:RNA 3'-terminal phosphate cyclase
VCILYRPCGDHILTPYRSSLTIIPQYTYRPPLCPGFTISIKRRGAAPKGGGLVEIFCPVVRQLSPLYLINSGKVRRVRGVVYGSRISPTVINRVIDAAKQVGDIVVVVVCIVYIVML